MPRSRRRGLRERGLTNARREILLFGYVMTAHGEEGFESEEQAQLMWKRYWEELTTEHNLPNCRPHAYYNTIWVSIYRVVAGTVGWPRCWIAG